jgi:hypothetical protein
LDRSFTGFSAVSKKRDGRGWNSGLILRNRPSENRAEIAGDEPKGTTWVTLTQATIGPRDDFHQSQQEKGKLRVKLAFFFCGSVLIGINSLRGFVPLRLCEENSKFSRSQRVAERAISRKAAKMRSREGSQVILTVFRSSRFLG